MSTFFFAAILVTFFGLTFGSFVNAAVWRLHQGRARSLLNDRSECIHCGHKLAWYDLIPVISWVSLRGRCRYCGKRIEDSPLVELGVAAFFLISFLFWPTAFNSATAVSDFVFWLVYGVLLAILFVYDLRYLLLPDKITFLLIGLATLQVIVHAVLMPGQAANVVADAVLGVAGIAGVYLVLYLAGRGRWVGFGDVKLAVFLGLVLASWRLALLTILLANFIALVTYVPSLLRRKRGWASRVPFGPFLILGFVIAQLFGRQIVDWYLSLLYL